MRDVLQICRHRTDGEEGPGDEHHRERDQVAYDGGRLDARRDGPYKHPEGDEQKRAYQEEWDYPRRESYLSPEREYSEGRHEDEGDEGHQDVEPYLRKEPVGLCQRS